MILFEFEEMRHKLQKKYLGTLILILGTFLLIGISFNTLIAQSSDKTTSKSTSTEAGENLSQIDWDEEETSEENGEEGLAGMNWDDDEATAEEASEEEAYNLDIKAEEALEKMILIKGFLFFIFYILGGILTAYFTRDRKLSVSYPPELLILLHTFWPIELLCLTFAGKKVR
jgi:hypothetical protein